MRYNIIPKEKFDHFTTKIVDKGIHIVIGWYGKKKKGQKGGADLTGFMDFLRPELKATGWLSQTANNMGQLPFAPDWTKIIANVAGDQLRKQGY